MIAASAQLHGLTVATRNVKNFVRCGVTPGAAVSSDCGDSSPPFPDEAC